MTRTFLLTLLVAATVSPGAAKAEVEIEENTEYYNIEGKPGKATLQGSFFFGGPTEFLGTLEKWRTDGELKGLELGYEP